VKYLQFHSSLQARCFRLRKLLWEIRAIRAVLLENFIVRRDCSSASRARNFGRISRACLDKSRDSLSFVLMPPSEQFVWILETLQWGIRRNVLISLMNPRGFSQKKVSLNAPSVCSKYELRRKSFIIWKFTFSNSADQRDSNFHYKCYFNFPNDFFTYN